MSKEVLIKVNTLKKLKIALDAQIAFLNKPEVLQEIPLHKKPILKLEKKLLKGIQKEVDEILKYE